MAKKTKDLEQTENKEVKAKSSATKKAKSTKTTTAKKTTVEKKSTASKKTLSAEKVSTAKKTASKSSTTKKASTKKTTTEKSTSKKSTSKTVSTKKAAVKKTSAKKGTTRKRAASKKAEKLVVEYKSEYYDLPYMYNKTVVKVLAQTPKMLFIYWEVAEEDRNNLINTYGKNFFEVTRPVLIVYNDTMHYSFEVDINDFANSWYLHINDANCDYHVELGRRPNYNNHYNNVTAENIEPVYIPYYIYLTSSNEMTAPNNRILFNPQIKSVKFRNIKTGQTIEKDINHFTFITNFGIFTIQDLYKFLYPNENFEYENIVVGNRSSGALSSSGMFSSQFK